MASRLLRALSMLAGVSVLACVFMVANRASPAGAAGRAGGDRALLIRCVRAVEGVGRAAAMPVPGSADPEVISQLTIFRRTRSPIDALPAASGLRATLAFADARTYDPTAAVRLSHDRAGDALYAVPAEISAPTSPAGCAGLRQFAGAAAVVALQAAQTGSGPGACLISTQVESRTPSFPTLPGMRLPRPRRIVVTAATVCKSAAVLPGYTGALGDSLLGPETRVALVPDGVATITYTLADGRQFAAPVVDNLARVPAALSIPPTLRIRTAAQFGRALAAHLPTTVTESGTGVNPIVILTRPASYIADAVGAYTFLSGLLRRGAGAGASATGIGSVLCRARTHRCVAVTVTTTCYSREHCRTSRTIRRYRYVGARPPAGTNGQQSLPTAPIVARTNRLLIRPRKLTLVLTGTPERIVSVVLSVSCFARNAAASSGGPVLKVAVPSRSPIALPGPARAFRACDVGVLVTSTQRGRVRVTVARA